MTATDHAKVLDTLAENLRKINSLRDFVAGVEVGAKIAGEMLTTMESAMNDVGRLLAVALLTATALTSASAATLKRFDDRLVLTGHIEMGDDVVFAAAAADRDVKTAVLGSHGGDVYVALSIAETVRERRLATVVPSSCESACTLIWAAGVERTGNGNLFVHCPRWVGHSECKEPARKDMVAHLKKMNAPSRLVELQETADANGVPIPPEEWQEVLPPRRRPPPYMPPPPPPGWIFIPSEQRAMPCLPTLLTFGVLRFCI